MREEEIACVRTQVTQVCTQVQMTGLRTNICVRRRVHTRIQLFWSSLMQILAPSPLACLCMRESLLTYTWLHIMDKKLLIYYTKYPCPFLCRTKTFFFSSYYTWIEWALTINISFAQSLIWTHEHFILINSQTWFHIDSTLLQSEGCVAHWNVCSKLMPSNSYFQTVSVLTTSTGFSSLILG